MEYNILVWDDEMITSYVSIFEKLQGIFSASIVFDHGNITNQLNKLEKILPSCDFKTQDSDHRIYVHFFENSDVEYFINKFGSDIDFAIIDERYHAVHDNYGTKILAPMIKIQNNEVVTIVATQYTLDDSTINAVVTAGEVALMIKKDSINTQNDDDSDSEVSKILASLIHNSFCNKIKLAERMQLLSEKLVEFGNIKGSSACMRELYSKLSRFSQPDSSVLILGETGTGKELVAKAIHENSPRKGKIFKPINLASFSTKDLLASELFGHRKGAFTDAFENRIGAFEYANGGTIFLDEIGEMEIPLQTMLLRVLQERSFNRVGENVDRKFDVRIIAATNQDLKQCVKEKLFREDLYYRLAVLKITVPPLRERGDDVISLANFFIKKYLSGTSRQIPRLSESASKVLMRYHWPGNVRELENTIESVVALASDVVEISVEHLPSDIRNSVNSSLVLNGESGVLSDSSPAIDGGERSLQFELPIKYKNQYDLLERFNAKLAVGGLKRDQIYIDLFGSPGSSSQLAQKTVRAQKIQEALLAHPSPTEAYPHVLKYIEERISENMNTNHSAVNQTTGKERKVDNKMLAKLQNILVDAKNKHAAVYQ